MSLPSACFNLIMSSHTLIKLFRLFKILKYFFKSKNSYYYKKVH